MVTFTAIVQKFGSKGEKTGWTYVEIPAEIAQQLKPDTKVSFRVKGTLDNYKIEQIALVPMGEGDFIMALNAEMRKGAGIRVGNKLTLKLSADNKEFQLSKDMMACLADDEQAMANFNKLAKGEQRYFSKWIGDAKTEATKEKRLTMTMDAMSKGWRYFQMIRAASGKEF